MKMKSNEIESRLLALLKLGDKTLPFKLSYAIGRNTENLEKEYNRINAERVKICEGFAAKDEEGKARTKINDGKSVFVFEKSEDEQRAVDAYNEILEIETDVNIFAVSIEDIERCESSEKYSALTVKEQREIMFMINAPKEK